jgi:FkbM family methyltransferase
MNPPINDPLALWKSFVGPTPAIVDLATTRLEEASRLLRKTVPAARFHTDPDGSFHQWLSDHRLHRIDLLLLDSIASLQRCRDLLFDNRIEAFLFPSPQDPAFTPILRYHQFSLFPLPGGMTLALHHRFHKQPADPALYIDVEALFRQFNLEPRGVIHVGAHLGQELPLYQRMGFKKILFIEANPAVYAKLAQRLQGVANATGVLCAVSDKNGLEILHVTDNEESSSLLPLKKHLERYPDIRETAQLLVSARRLDHLLREINQDPADFNYLHLDIQGAELMALRGAPLALPFFDALSVELNYDELYEGCPLVDELDAFLGARQFQRVFTSSNPDGWGDGFYLRAPAVSMRTLGSWGRFGNQVFEYAFLRLFAREHRLRVETPAWIGNQLFGTEDAPLPPRPYPQHAENTYALQESKLAHLRSRPGNLDIRGVFQYHSAYYAPQQTFFRSLFQPVPALKATLDRALDTLKAARDARDLVVLHLRRGDYGYGMFFIPPNAWYLDWLRALWPTLERPLLYLATDEPAKVLADFAAYHPATAADLHLPRLGADYYPDFWAMTQADALATANSTFSFAAAMLNERARHFHRPDLFASALRRFDPWNAEPLLHRELGLVDYRVVHRIAADFRNRPGEAQLSTLLRHYRAQLADSFTQLRGDQLPLVLAGDLWTCYRILRGTPLRLLPLLPQERPIVASIRARLDAACARPGRHAADPLGPYIAATLYDPASALPAPPESIATLPAPVIALLQTP